MWSFFYLINKKAHLEFFIWSPSTDGCAVFSPSHSNLQQHLNLYFLAQRSTSLICTYGKLSVHVGLFVVACVIFNQTCIKIMFLLDLCLSGSAPMDVLGNGACPRTGPPHWRGVFKGLVWPLMGAANTARLLPQFYFHIISISKRKGVVFM